MFFNHAVKHCDDLFMRHNPACLNVIQANLNKGYKISLGFGCALDSLRNKPSPRPPLRFRDLINQS